MFRKLVLAAALSVAGFFSAPQAAQAQVYWLGQVVIGGWNFCPRSTIEADGQLLAISQFSALFSLYGTMYGGDGRTTFGVPDLRGRIAMHNGRGPGLDDIRLGQRGGRNDVTLNTLNLPSHNHIITNTVTTSVNVGNGPAGAYGAGEHIASAANIYAPNGSPTSPLDPATVGVAVNSTALNNGGSQSFNIANPFLGLQFCVVMQGIFPSRN